MEKYGVDKSSQKDDLEKKAEEKRQEKKEKKPRQHIKEVPAWAKDRPKQEQEQIMDNMEEAAKELKSVFNEIFKG